MTNSKGKTTTIAVAFLMILAMAIALLALPGEKQSATAQTEYMTFPYINAVPNPVGVGQEVLLHIGITQQMDSAEDGWEGLSVTIERPDGETDTIEDIRTDSTGGTGRTYVPDIEGSYYLQTHFPEQWWNTTDWWGAAVDQLYLASDSPVLELVVQAEPIEVHPGHALPTEYWTRPIDAQLREWGAIAGSSWEEEYNDAPESAHILWTRPHTIGGVVGGSLGEHAFECGDAYEGKWGGGFFGGGAPFISAGRLYYNHYASSEEKVEYVCTDVRTGEVLWTKSFLNNLTITFAQLMYWDTYDYHGVYDYLWASGDSGTRALLGTPGNPLCAFDSVTGEFSWAFYALPSGSRDVGPKGEILYYDIDLEGGYMTLWNSSAVLSLRASDQETSMGFGQWKAMGRIVNATDTAPVTSNTPLGLQGYTFNISIPTGLEGSVREIIWGDRVKGAYIGDDETEDWAFSLEYGKEGTSLYNHHASYVAPDVEPETSSGPLYLDGEVEDHVHLRWQSSSRKYWAYSLDTGALLWKSEDFEETKDGEHYLNHYDRNTETAYGNIYSTGVSGIIYCYNFQTGLNWTYKVTDPYSEILWNNEWWQEIQFVTDGKIYTGHCEHSPIDPKPRDAPYMCLNATTGEVIWRANGMFRQTHWGGSSVIGDSVICTQDTYDQRVYAIGKGPSATTVSIQSDVITHGETSLVTGTVTDVSPGTSDIKLTLRFPNGVPAVCDDNMSDWMVYVYKQFERPADVLGVEVVISVFDPNGNTYEVGTTTSDATGFFSCEFVPLVPGKYTVIASFDGSKSYYGSFAETALFVEEAPQPTPTPTPTPASVADLYFVPAVSGIIVAIVVVGVLLALLLLRRR